MHALVNPAPARGSPYFFWENSGCPVPLKNNYLTFWNACDNRMKTMSPEERVLPINEETATTITQAGFVLQWKGGKSKPIGDQELCDMIFETQFLTHHKQRYHDLCSKFAKCEKAPRTKPELEDFKALLLLDIRYLLGCDIEWRQHEAPASGAAATANSAPEPVLGSGKSDDDNGSSDAEPTAPPDASPVFGVGGEEEPAAAAAVAPAPAPAAAPERRVVLALNPAAADDDNAPIFKAVDPANFFEWSPDTWGTVDYSAIKLPADDQPLASLRSFFAIAIIMFYTPDLQAKHQAWYDRFVKRWQDSFGYPLDAKRLEEPPTVGPLAFTAEEVVWLTETRRLLTHTVSKRKSTRHPPRPQRPPPSPPPSSDSRRSEKRRRSSSGGGASKGPENKSRRESPATPISRLQCTPTCN